MVSCANSFDSKETRGTVDSKSSVDFLLCKAKQKRKRLLLGGFITRLAVDFGNDDLHHFGVAIQAAAINEADIENLSLRCLGSPQDAIKAVTSNHCGLVSSRTSRNVTKGCGCTSWLPLCASNGKINVCVLTKCSTTFNGQCTYSCFWFVKKVIFYL